MPMLWIKLFHALCWVYWLGADVGTFYAARFIARPDLTPAARATAAKIMLGIDLAPRICMPLTLASGLHLAAAGGHLALDAGAIAAVWAIGLAWMGTAVWLHHAAPGARKDRIARFDFAWRGLLVLALIVLAFRLAPWLAVKVSCFAATVVCGMAIRVHLKPFGPAFGALMSSGPSEAINTTIASSIARCVPYVLVIWVLLLVSAAVGMRAWVV
jgi:hypothetical protein